MSMMGSSYLKRPSLMSALTMTLPTGPVASVTATVFRIARSDSRATVPPPTARVAKPASAPIASMAL